MSPLAQRIAGSLFQALGEHLLDAHPEFRMLAQGLGRLAAAPPKSVKVEVIEKRRKRKPATVDPQSNVPDCDVIDLEKKPDGSWGPKEKR